MPKINTAASYSTIASTFNKATFNVCFVILFFKGEGSVGMESMFSCLYSMKYVVVIQY